MQNADYLRLLSQIKRHEGANRDASGNHVAYRCPAGALTIGYGHNLDAIPVPGINDTITEDQAERLLRADVLDVQEKLQLHLPWITKIDPARYAVMVNMAFNLGVGGLLAFKRTVELVRIGDYRHAADEMLRSKWAGQVGARAKELAEQMRTGTWQ